MQKGFSGIIVLIAILVLAGLACGVFYYFQKIPKYGMGFVPDPPEVIKQIQTSTSSSAIDETANWKTYTNQENGIIFKFPQDWIGVIKKDKKKLENQGELGKPDILEIMDKSETQYSPVTLLIYANDNNLSLKEFQDELRKELAGDSIPLWTQSDAKTINPNGISVYFGNEELCGTYRCRRYSWSGNNKIFELILYNDYLSVYDKVFDQILSTFKFLP